MSDVIHETIPPPIGCDFRFWIFAVSYSPSPPLSSILNVSFYLLVSLSVPLLLFSFLVFVAVVFSVFDVFVDFPRHCFHFCHCQDRRRLRRHLPSSAPTFVIAEVLFL